MFLLCSEYNKIFNNCFNILLQLFNVNTKYLRIIYLNSQPLMVINNVLIFLWKVVLA